MNDKIIETLFSELTQDELRKITESDINLDCELDGATLERIRNNVQSQIGRELSYNREEKSMKKLKKFRIALIAAALAVIMTFSVGAVYRFVMSDDLKTSMNLETVERIKTIVDTDAVNEDTVKTMQKTVSSYGHTITFEAIVEGTAIKKSLEFIITQGAQGEAVEVDKSYAVFTVKRDDGGAVFYNPDAPRYHDGLGYVVLLDNYAPTGNMFDGSPAFYEEDNVLYFLCDITDAYVFADRDLSIAIFGNFVVSPQILRVDEKGEHYFVESYRDIQAIFDFDLDDKYADSQMQADIIAEKPYVFNTNPDYTESDEIVKKDMEFINSGVDLSYAIGARKWKGSYPLQFGKVEHFDDFINLYKNRKSLNTVNFATLEECVNNALDAFDAMVVEFIVEKTGKAIEDVTDDELNALGAEFEAYKAEHGMFSKNYVDGKISLNKFGDGSEYAYLGENRFLFFSADSENAKFVIVAGEKAVISLDVTVDDMRNLCYAVDPENNSYPGYVENIWYIEGGVTENSIYAYAYDADDYNTFISQMIITPTEAIYNIAMEFASYNGTIQVK